jgi:hypothetical protein
MFYSTYLAKRSLIGDFLEKQNKLDLVATNRALTDLRLFFGRLKAGNFDEGWEFVMRLNFLPTSNADLSAKVSQYQQLDPVLKDAFPALLRGAMGCLYSQHSRIKSESHPITTTAQARLKDLQEKSRLLHTFAGLANVSGDVKDEMTRIEAHMI